MLNMKYNAYHQKKKDRERKVGAGKTFQTRCKK